jgi:iron(III) transport system ATP-binding protein
MSVPQTSAEETLRSDTAAPYIQVDRVWKQFGTFPALMDVSFDIEPGEFVCLLGPSGCGKTTLLRIIMGLELQTRGRILKQGDDISRLPAAERAFGIVFQSYALFPNLTVFDNVAYGLHSRKRSSEQIKARVEEMLTLIGMQDAGRRYPAQLSGGQQQRVALARALAPSPNLLLLDEPLSALDARLRIHLRHEVRSLQRRLGVTTVLVTHDQEEALTMADRIVVMNQGVIEQIGTPMDIYRNPATPFVADFVGEMNFLQGVLINPSQVRVGTFELTCRAADGIPPGTSVVACFRPEDVDVREAASLVANAVPVEIIALDFLGSFYRATLKLAVGHPVEIKADISTQHEREFALVPGRTLTIAVPTDRMLVFAKA